MQEIKWYDRVFSANKRNTNNAIMALAKWLTVEQLEKAHKADIEAIK